MGLEITAPEPIERQQRRQRRRLELVLLTSFVLCLLVGLLALAALFLLRTSSTGGESGSPLELVEPRQIVPGLALKRLAGEAAEPLAYQAINAGELETALALILFSTDTPAQSRSVLYERLPRRFRDLGNEERAAEALLLTRSLSVLEPRLPAMERAQMLILSAEIYLAAEENEHALDAVQQAKRIGEQTPDLLPAQRAQIFERLRPLALAVDDLPLIQEINELLRNPRLEPGGMQVDAMLYSVAEPLAVDEAVAAATEARQVAAQALIARLIQVAGRVEGTELDANIAPEREALAQALLYEDQIRSEYMTTGGTDISLGQQITLLRRHRAWLVLKLQVAQQGFGLPLVGDWEGDQDSILSDLSITTDNISMVLEEYLSRALEEAERKASLRTEKWLWLALQYEVGLHPFADVDVINNQLRFAQDELANVQGAAVALPVFYDTTLDVPGFRISDTN